VDWGIVISDAITGVVGIAGIGGSIVSAKLAGKSATQNLQTTIRAENDRAELVGKQRIYAHYQACCLTTMMAAITHRSTRQPQDQSDRAQAAAAEARDALVGAYSEVRLIAPASVHEPAGERLLQLMAYIDATYKGASLSDPPGLLPDSQEKLVDAMRADLGEPTREDA
jgi:hypothetical protein